MPPKIQNKKELLFRLCRSLVNWTNFVESLEQHVEIPATEKHLLWASFSLLSVIPCSVKLEKIWIPHTKLGQYTTGKGSLYVLQLSLSKITK